MKKPVNPKHAAQIQREMRSQVSLTNNFGTVKTIAGIDVGYDNRKNLAKAALVIMDVTTLTVLDSFVAIKSVDFPYIPGLLSFREAPVIMKVLQNLNQNKPDMLFIDGHGVAHPRNLGIAAHIGVLSDYPTIGVAKKKLCGTYIEPDLIKGSTSILHHKNERIGTVLRSRNNVKPLFISPGHKVDHDTAVNLVKRCLVKYRLPEPTRLADKLSKVQKL